MGCVNEKTARTRPTCPQEHPLKHLKSGKAMHECSRCQKAIRSFDYLCCEECMYKLCLECSGKPPQ